MNLGQMAVLDQGVNQGLDLWSEEEKDWLEKLLVLFREKRLSLRIVPDRLILAKIRNLGFDNFLEHASALLGGKAELATTWCIDNCLWTAIENPPLGSSTCVNTGTSSDIPTLGNLRCVNKEDCSKDDECMLKLAGEVNSGNFVIATLKRPETFNGCPRLPVMTYNSTNVLMICRPSPEQLAFSRRNEADQERDILRQATRVSAELKRFKQSQRNKRK